jgi:glyceraldehyde-3-phosphate dehydrogenase/erythrose-4-phosphate dehydrogenase
MKKIKISICGGFGRMGKILIKKILKSKNLILYSVTDLKVKKSFNGIKTQKNSLNAFKKAVYEVNYLVSLINDNSLNIISSNQYASVIQPIVEKNYNFVLFLNYILMKHMLH